MPAISRATLPQEFFDITSAQLLLQPEPQYLHAQLIKSAMAAELDAGGALGLPIPGREFGQGGAPYANLEAARMQLSDPIYREAIKVVAEFDKNQIGHTIKMNRPKFTDSTYSEVSRRVPVGTTIGTTPIAVESEQVPVTIERFAGPYSNTLSAVAPYAVERFDANRGVHSMAAIKEFHLKRDFDKTIDSFGVSLFDQATIIVRPAGMASDSTPVVAGDYPFSYALIVETQRQLLNAKIPTFANGRYLMVLNPNQTAQLNVDPQFLLLARYHEDFNPLFKASYFRTVGRFDILESTQLTQVTNGNGVAINYGQAFGPGMVGLGVGEMPRTSYHTNDNYGETALVIWLWYAGFQVLDNRFGVSIRTS